MSDRFIVTKEHRRFIEFADAVRHGHTIGLCFGAAGVDIERAGLTLPPEVMADTQGW